MANFKRIIKVRVRKIEISYPEIYMEGEINYGGDSLGNKGKISIYNLKAKTILDNFEVGNVIQIFAGYDNDIGMIYNGQIAMVHTRQQGVDRVTEIELSNFNDSWLNQQLTDVKLGGISSKELASVCVEKLNASLKTENKFSLNYTGKEIQYEKTIVAFGKRCYDLLQKIARDTGNRLIINGTQITISNLINTDTSTYSVIEINSKTGLIGSPEMQKRKTEKDKAVIYEDEASYDKQSGVFGVANDIGRTIDTFEDNMLEDFNEELEPNYVFKITTLLNYEIKFDSLIRLKSKYLSGDYKILKYSHNLGSFVTEIDAINL